MAGDGLRSLRIQLLIGFMCVAMVVYFVMLGRIAFGSRSAPRDGVSVDVETDWLTAELQLVDASLTVLR